MKSRLNKFLAFALVLITILGVTPINIFAADFATVKILSYDENNNLIKEYSKKVTNNAMADFTDIKTDIANSGYVVVGFFSEFVNGEFSNKLTDNSIYISGDTTIFAQTYKEDNSNIDIENLAYDFNIFFNRKQSVSKVGSRYYNLNGYIEEINKQGYEYEAAYGDAAFTEKIPDDTCIDLYKYPNIYIKARGIKFYCISSSGLSKYTYYAPLKKGSSMQDIDIMLAEVFTNGDKIAFIHYSDEAHKNKINDISYFNNFEGMTIPVYTVAYFKESGPVTEKTYKISFDLNAPNGKSATGSSSFSAKKGYTTTLETPKCEGYSFLGWYDGDTKVNIKYVVSKNVTLKARWTEIKSENNKDNSDNKEESKKPDNPKVENTKTESKIESSEVVSSENISKENTKTTETIKPDETSKKDNVILHYWRSSLLSNSYKNI